MQKNKIQKNKIQKKYNQKPKKNFQLDNNKASKMKLIYFLFIHEESLRKSLKSVRI